jgi:hypothetical protein
MEESDLDLMEPFLDAASRGFSRKGSSGEVAAFALAKQAIALSSTLQDMDSGLRESYFALLRVLACPDSRQFAIKRLKAAL